jgi:cellulose synthase/poly-beta-1,6-N-acetylglucosamine synthase-like glycosyltransferase
MRERLKVPRIMVNWRQILIGLTALIFGLLVYLVNRPPDQTYFIYVSGLNISLYNTLPNIFGLIGNSVPAFIHVFSFILITAGFLSCQKRGCLIICLSWLLVDSAFELGQNFNTWSASIIPDCFERIPFLENTKSYFIHGTFDFTDLAAIAFGTLTAYLVLLSTNKSKRRVIR